MTAPLDILAFGAHPDDVEIGMAGTLAKYKEKGLRVGICDLTMAELSSNGTVAIRQKEAKHAGEILGLDARIQLNLPDRGLTLSDEHIKEVVSVIRKYKPKVIFAPYWEDRHPDHGNCAKIVEEAAFSSGIRRFAADDDGLEAHKIQNLFFYMINGMHQAQFYIDITKYVDKKTNALMAYESQFEVGENGVVTPLTNGYVDSVISREKVFGKQIGSVYAEGFFAKAPLIINNDLIGGI
ncbi:bacillithiol biosynthesis deacetylase BshB1 [Bacillus tianshenii]|uniref:Bacillithiol biosynthesis deacetylase BshB1 n=1 Tax=Sutcliffiella tianshenii TaxID=1463404 RepID=A0ABS2NY26_9BACI|nr:bacillithiol biosynthesis deacetylase BshB1 [Bacillus tianshenii]MBM7619524.1 bacillithiol biosynthesis deacetylase BshB1 [Bacillus tianshenii]